MRLYSTAIVVTLACGPALAHVHAQEQPRAVTASVEDLQRVLERQQALLEMQGREIEQLRRRLEQMEHSGAGAAASPTGPGEPANENQSQALPELSARQPEIDDFPGAFPIPGSDAKLKIGGQIRTLLVRNIGAVGTDDRFVTSSIPVEGTTEADKTSRTTLSSSPSRFNLDLRTPSSVGAIRAFVEGDFAGTSKVYRLRHAFGQWHDFLAGQTWSTFSDPEAEPDGIDFEGLNAISLFRQPQFRWTRSVSTRASLAIALENPSPDITGANGVNQVPDVVARVRFEPAERSDRRLLRGGGHLQAAYLLRQIRGEPIDGIGQVLSTGGTGYHVSGRVPAPWRRSDYVTFATALGSGIGRYITDLSSEGGQDAVYDPVAASLRALFAMSHYIGYEHWWTETLRSTSTYGFVHVSNLDVQSHDALHETMRASVNVAWSPVSRVDLVVEGLAGRRVNKDGRQGKAGQVQFGSTFRF